MKFKAITTRHGHGIKRSKRLVVLILSGVVITVLAVYGIFSALYWQTYDRHSNTAAHSLYEAINLSLGDNTLKTPASQQIDTVVTNFNKEFGQNPCETSALYAWQTIVPALKDLRSTCDQRLSAATAVIAAMKPVSQYLEDQQKATDLLIKTQKNTEEPNDYAAASTSWKAVESSPDLSKNDEFKATRAQVIDVSTTISTAYADLATASSKEDKAAFDTATDNLKTAYGKVETLKTSATDERTKLIKAFTDAYKKI
ncbi:MAG: hypothetical protein ABIP50_04260 [Candidatus Saccharimonadales bacterium]